MQIKLRRTMTLKQVAEKIQTDANVRDVEELTFSHQQEAKKPVKINVLTDPKRDCCLKDLKSFDMEPVEKDNFWEFLERDRPEELMLITDRPEHLDYPEEYSIKYELKKN
jgi:hypothetical protein